MTKPMMSMSGRSNDEAPMDMPEWLKAILHKETCKLSEQERKRLTRWVIAQIIKQKSRA